MKNALAPPEYRLIPMGERMCPKVVYSNFGITECSWFISTCTNHVELV